MPIHYDKDGNTMGTPPNSLWNSKAHSNFDPGHKIRVKIIVLHHSGIY